MYIKEEKINFLQTKTTESECSIFMRIATGSLQVSVPQEIEREMERTTKKKPPKNTDMHMIFSNFDEYEGSMSMTGGIDLFKDLIPSPGTQGKIFIGFPTHQTTGCSVHFAAQLIPTVERESIDFVDKTLAIWNQEILAMGGLLTRVLFEDDLDSIAKLYTEMKLDSTGETWLLNKGIHNFVSFDFQSSTPSNSVGRILNGCFHKLCTRPLRFLSTRGILPAHEIRLQDKRMMEFLKTIPVVPDATLDRCKDWIKRLTESGLLKRISLDDVFKEISARTLTREETISLFQWWLSEWREKRISRQNAMDLGKILVLESPENKKEPLVMSNVKYFIDPHMVPKDLPLPLNVLPIEISIHFIKKELEQAFW